MIKNNFTKTYKALLQSSGRFDKASSLAKIQLLTVVNNTVLPGGQRLLLYHDLLLFFCAYPVNKTVLKLAEKELKRIAVLGKQLQNTKKALPENEGLPYTNTITRFSPDFLSWLLQHKDITVEFDSFYNPSLSLNDILNITLPTVLKSETTAGLNNEELLEVLHIKPNQYAAFLLGQLESLQERPLLKELFIERMDLYVKLVPKNQLFARSFNRMPVKDIFFHTEILKKFDHRQLINEPLPVVSDPGKTTKQQLSKIIKNAMALTVREIDPATFLQENTMRVFNLERGLTIAVYSMVPRRQLPLETYFGFTFLKNGIPVSYGGIWAFGRMAKLGLNIFEPYRGGESGYVLCQLIRVCKQFLGTTYFEIEPYQFGLDNPGGISSGAFWFYYKYGFKPVDKDLNLLAENEYHKIKTRSNYRSTAKTLIRFTGSNMGLNLEAELPLNVQDVMSSVLAAINKNWQHNYADARLQAINTFCKKVKIDFNVLSGIQQNVAEEIALWAMALNVNNGKKLQMMREMVFVKTKDDYTYQQLLLEFFIP